MKFLQGLGDYDMVAGAQDAQYRNKFISDWKSRAAKVTNDYRSKLAPADAIFALALDLGGLRIIGYGTNASQLGKDLLALVQTQPITSADQGFSLFANMYQVDRARSKTSAKSTVSFSKPGDKALFVKTFDVSKSIFTNLKNLLGDPNAFWPALQKACESLSFEVYDDSTHPLYYNIKDTNISNGLTITKAGILAGASAAIGVLNPSQNTLAFGVQRRQDQTALHNQQVQARRQQQVVMKQQQATQQGDESTEEGLSTGAMVGIGVGALVVIGGVAAFAINKKRNKAKRK
jgi:hypothetical protein